ncbi:lytic transglycosylase [Sphingomonas sp. Leaf24]|uniref:lytic transglycosylase domain-containing protein n=1 Tax=unclassified Sphingomonas TaxID=196159 RepID=UPI0006F21219|nr:MULTISPECIES: lytic transglycosylase domain-containing protein [unclassified Sphingomonas]KQM17236.1 lytic transglycosylase [Sphingomonas sp. Leaf5]KQM88128.1 lytic transglycosylase [Sphingomonas sp. Leaf24]
MGALRLAIALAVAAIPLPVLAQQAPAPVVDRVLRWQPFIAEASVRFGIRQTWIVRVMRAESGGNTHLGGRLIRSRAGAIGLMQLMPGTWAAMREAHGLGTDPDQPRDNILAGTAYLRAMYDRFGYPGCFAAYNAGPGRYAAYLARRSTLTAETVGYLAAVTGRPAALAIAADSPPRQLLFALRRDLQSAPQTPAPVPAESGLFAVRKGRE